MHLNKCYTQRLAFHHLVFLPRLSVLLFSTKSNIQTVDVFQKYAHKLKGKGINNSDELIQKAKSIPSMPSVQNQNKLQREKEKDPILEKQHAPSYQKKLKDILKLELLKDLESSEIGELWNQYHSEKPVLSASLSPEFYKDMMDYAQAFPFFVLPLPRNEGYEFFFLQFNANTHQIYFTSLIEYQTHGPNAKPLFILTYYIDLLESKQVILMLGEYGQESFSNLLSLIEAQNLVYQLQLYYVTHPDKRGLVKRFHKDPKGFNFNDLIMQQI